MPSCVAPWIPFIFTGVPVGVTWIIVGVYVPVNVFFVTTPALSRPNSTSTEIVAGAGIPLKSLFGVNVTSPVSGTIVYVPILLVVPFSNASTVVSVVTVPVFGSTNFAGCVAEAVTGVDEVSTLNVGWPFCVNPCKFLLSALFTLVETTTSGIYNPSIEFKTSLIFVMLGSFVGL